MYISNIFGHAQLCVNDYFAPNSFYAKGEYFRVYLLFSVDNRLDRALI